MKTQLSLPIPADRIIPHRPPMRLIDRLMEFDRLQGVVESIIPLDGMFITEDGSIEPVAMVELVAQSFAAVKGYADLLGGKPVGKGFLVGVKRFRFPGTAYGGDRLLTVITRVGETIEFALAEGRVMRGEEVIASGNVMVWIPKEG